MPDIPIEPPWTKGPERLVFCARNRDRTGTDVTPLVFETNASTNSATRALVGTKVRHFFRRDKCVFLSDRSALKSIK